MAEPRHLSKAPIREAMVDIRVKSRPSLDAQDLAVLQRQVADEFPKVEKQQFFKATVKPIKGQVSTEERFAGFICHSADSLNVVQFRVDGFTFNRLRPYTHWEAIWETAFPLWESYCAVALPEAITRMALRYINRIDLPQDYNLGRVLTNPPAVPLSEEVSMGRYSSKVTVNSRNMPGVAAHVTQVIDKKPEMTGAVLLLDVDAFRNSNLLATDDGVDQRIHETFSQLREFKNRLFFSSLTDDVIGEFV